MVKVVASLSLPPSPSPLPPSPSVVCFRLRAVTEVMCQEETRLVRESPSLSPADRRLLSIYHHSFDDEKVDLNLILVLLLKLHSDSTEGTSSRSLILSPHVIAVAHPLFTSSRSLSPHIVAVTHPLTVTFTHLLSHHRGHASSLLMSSRSRIISDIIVVMNILSSHHCGRPSSLSTSSRSLILSHVIAVTHPL